MDLSPFYSNRSSNGKLSVVIKCEILRVLLFNDHGMGGGAERYVDTVADALKVKGIDTVKLCRVLGGDGWIELGGVPEVRLSDYIKVNVRYQKLLDQILFKFKPDIVHVNEVQLYYAHLLVKLSRKHCAKLVLTTHNYGYVCPTALYVQKPKMKPCNRPYFNAHCPKCLIHFRSCITHKVLDASKILYSMGRWSRFLRSFDAIISPSRRFAELLRGSTGVGVHHMWNPLPKTFLEEQSARNKSSQNKVLFVGRLVKVKGAHLLPAIAKLLDGTALVEVIGSGPLATNLSKDDNLVYRGYVSEDVKKRLLDECKVGIVPSLWSEMFPTTVIESLSRARPVVAFDLGGQAEQIKASGGGFTAKPFYIYDFVQKVEMLIHDHNVASKTGYNGQSWIKDNADPTYYARKLLRIYENMI